MKAVVYWSVFSFLFGCASSPKNAIGYKEKSEKGCIQIGTLRAEGFSIIPFIGKSLAKSMLEKKAEELNMNTIVITKEVGFFHTELEANGFKCKNN